VGAELGSGVTTLTKGFRVGFGVGLVVGIFVGIVVGIFDGEEVGFIVGLHTSSYAQSSPGPNTCSQHSCKLSNVSQSTPRILSCAGRAAFVHLVESVLECHVLFIYSQVVGERDVEGVSVGCCVGAPEGYQI